MESILSAIARYGADRKTAFNVLGSTFILAVLLLSVKCKRSQPMSAFATHEIEAMAQAEGAPIVDPASTFSMWVWRADWANSEAERARLISFCEDYNLNHLLVQIHFEPGSAEQGNPTLLHTDELRDLIAKASQRGIRVEALDGQASMARAVNHARTLAILDAILDFNHSLPENERLVGMHYDIEPYATASWNSPERLAIMREYLTFLKFAGNKLRSEESPLKLGASIPFWYDRMTESDNSCMVDFQGVQKNFHQHIQDLTDYVAVMSYRRFADGDNSISYHIADELAYAEQIGRAVWAGLETTEVPETPDLSFRGLPPEEFWHQKEQVEAMHSNRLGFGGIVVHDYSSFSEYLDTAVAQAE